ncbi:MAG TPA: helix-turn-helix transcriptional regulator [Streptosporangiaceae bacterium]|jgi:DNA-binding CsgD family transcriptional regulator
MPQDHCRGTRCRCPSAARHFTDREIDVLLLVAAGQPNRRIAQALGISTRTVDHHLRVMLGRAGAASRAELIARSYAAGVLVSHAWPPAWSGAACVCVCRSGPGRARPR